MLDNDFRLKRKRDVPREELWYWYCQWKDKKVTKNTIERTVLGDPYAHGKLITRLWREQGWETEKVHPMLIEIRRLITLCEKNGVVHGSKYS